MDTNAITSITSSNDLSDFIHRLCRELLDYPERWENADLSAFLNALAAWVSDSDGYFRNQDQPVPTAEMWQLVATVLAAAANYE